MSLITCAACSTAYAADLSACPHCGAVRAGGSVLPCVVVRCVRFACPAFDQRRRVVLVQVGPGVLHLPGVLLCALCGGEMERMEVTLPKITVHGGPSNAAADGPPSLAAEAAPSGGGEQPSPGSSSSTSAARPQTSPTTSGGEPPKRARTTGSRSGGGRRGSSTAGSTDTSGPAEGPTLALGLTAKASAEVKAGGE